MKKPAASARGNTISNRLLICFLVSTLIPTVLITVLLCLRFDRLYRRSAVDQMQVSLDLIGDYVNSYLDEVATITGAPYYHSYFSSQKSIRPEDADYLNEVNEFQTEMEALLGLTTYSHSDISDLIIWSDGQYLYQSLYHELWYFPANMVMEEQPWYDRALTSDGSPVFTPLSAMEDTTGEGNQEEDTIDTSSFFITRKIRNLRQPEQVNLVILNLTSRHFDTELTDMNLLYNSFVLLTNEYGELIYSSKPLTSQALEEALAGTDFRYDGSRWSSLSTTVADFPLTVHVVYSLDDIGRHTAALIFSAVCIYLAGLCLAFILFRRYNRWISHSAHNLLATFSELESGNLDVRCSPVDVEEFNQIGSSVNQMIEKLNEKIKNEYLMTIQQKSIELYALRSQIQPHFLINTIYCFITLNQIGEADKLNAAFYNLAHLLRYVLSHEYYTTLGQEKDFIEDYLKLQKLRFGNRLSYEIQCPDELNSIRIPRLLLQPLVENAIIHGIEPSETPCLCSIRIFRSNGLLHLLVEDNGVGFDPEELERKSAEAARTAFRPDPGASMPASGSAAVPAHKTSVGLYYVRERLKIWAEGAVLSIRCEEVTRAEITIPEEVIDHEAADR